MTKSDPRLELHRPGHVPAAFSARPELEADSSRAGGGARLLVPGLALAFAAAGVALVVQRLVPTLSPLLVAIVLGVALANVRTLPAIFMPGVQVAARRLLRLGIVLLGLQLALPDILALGGAMIVVVVCIVALGMGGTLVMGRALGVPPMQRLLIASGFSICGAAAVAAVDGAVDADEEDVATAIGLVVLFGTLMIGLAPAVLGRLGLSLYEEGLVAGGSIHEVAQVVAAGGIIGGGALAAAVVVKLARVLMLAPVIAVIGLAQRRSAHAVHGSRPALVPLFIAGFLGMAVVRTLVPVAPGLLASGKVLQTVLLSAAMFALGCGVRIRTFRSVGGRPVVLAALSTAWVFGLALSGVVLVG